MGQSKGSTPSKEKSQPSKSLQTEKALEQDIVENIHYVKDLLSLPEIKDVQRQITLTNRVREGFNGPNHSGIFRADVLLLHEEGTSVIEIKKNTGKNILDKMVGGITQATLYRDYLNLCGEKVVEAVVIIDSEIPSYILHHVQKYKLPVSFIEWGDTLKSYKHVSS